MDVAAESSAPANPGPLVARGVELRRNGRLDEARECLRRALEADPESLEALGHLGLTLAAAGEHAAAAGCYERALAMWPGHPDLLCNLGSVRLAEGRLVEAVECYSEAVTSDRGHVAAHYGLALALQREGTLDAAELWYQRTLRLDPEHAGAYLNLGGIYRQKRQLAAAVDFYRQAARFRPGDPVVCFNLGAALNMTHRLDEAIACHRRVLDILPEHPGSLSDMGVALMRLGRLDEAVDLQRRAVALAPDWVGGLSNLAVTHVRRHELAEAHACFDRALAMAPDDQYLNFNNLNLYLLEGDFEKGMPLFTVHRDFFPLRYHERRWRGESLEGRTILLYAEYGRGDTLQFVRYVPVMAELGGRIILQVHDALKPLLRCIGGVDALIGLNEPPPEFDVQAMLLELPWLLGHTAETIPMQVPYLQADPALERQWASRLAAADGFKVGLVWQGNPRQIDGLYRSCRLADCAPLATVPGVRLYSLQHGEGSEQLAALGDELRITDFGADLDTRNGAYMDTAAIMSSLDLVVTIDTSICHLAGALARPVWTALPYWADWRWMLDRSDTRWYPTMRLFRQPRPFEWRAVFEEIAAALEVELRERFF